MRFDQVGMWWQDHLVEKSTTRAPINRVVEVPATGWKRPSDFPNLANAKVLGLDTETKDLELMDRGPGAVRGAAHSVGFSLATEDASWYFPYAHEYGGQTAMNMDKANCLQWLDAVLAHPVPIVGANLMYDLEVLRAEGVRMPAGEIFDIQHAEPLIDEESRHGYNLDALGLKYLGAGKDTPLLYQWCADSFGGKPDFKQRGNIWRAPPTLVGPYAEADALMPLQILAKQRIILADEELTDLFRMECALIPLLLDMRFRGVRVDLAKAEHTAKWLREEAKKFQTNIPGVDVWSGEQLGRLFDKAGVAYLRTEAGNPSFTKVWLEACDHPLAKSVLGVRQYEKAANPFVEAYILGHHHNGRIHCRFNPLRGDEYGAVTGRFSSSDPNLQNIPVRDQVLGPLLRSLFIPEEGCRWRKGDHSQVEYRGLIHYAVGKGSDEARALYNKDPKTDYHQFVQAQVLTNTGITLDRRPAKNLNFGMVFGMGEEKLVRSLGVSVDIGERLYDAYHVALPYTRKTFQSAERLAKRRGYIKTILGRRRRFKIPEHCRKALNACLQGSAADILKKGMVDCHKAGVFADTGIPHLTVHDELDWSDEMTARSKAAFVEAKRIMENCMPKLKVPLIFDMTEGNNWGDCL